MEKPSTPISHHFHPMDLPLVTYIVESGLASDKGNQPTGFRRPQGTFKIKETITGMQAFPGHWQVNVVAHTIFPTVLRGMGEFLWGRSERKK